MCAKHHPDLETGWNRWTMFMFGCLLAAIFFAGMYAIAFQHTPVVIEFEIDRGLYSRQPSKEIK